jgi:hypothetical protein
MREPTLDRKNRFRAFQEPELRAMQQAFATCPQVPEKLFQELLEVIQYWEYRTEYWRERKISLIAAKWLLRSLQAAGKRGSEPGKLSAVAKATPSR